MTFRSLRERNLLSQEKLAELSGLSLRTIQRLEAGHRVSYASLRALSTTLKMDVDQLERELYAVNKSTDEFVEIPRWVRLWINAAWYGGPHPSRRQAHILEALCIVGGVVVLAASFLVTSGFMTTVSRVTGSFALVCGYFMSVSIRVVDTYKLWSAREISPWEWRPVRTVRSTVFDYSFVLVVLISFFAVVFWLTD